MLIRDGATVGPMEPRVAEQALRDRIDQFGPKRLIVGLRVGPRQTPPAARRAMDSAMRTRWAEDVEAAKQQFRARLSHHVLGEDAYHFQPIVALPYVALYADADLLEKILADDAVVSINTEALGSPLLVDTVPLVGADTAHSNSYTGSGYSVAVIDTGIDAAHAMFSGKLVSEACYSTPASGQSEICANYQPNGSTASGSGGPNTDFGFWHGGHVAGVAVGASVTPGGSIPNLKGVGVGANLISIQALSKHGTNVYRFSEGDILSALGRVSGIASTHQVVAVNMSLVLDVDSSGFFSSACNSTWPAVVYAVNLLNEAGVMVVAGSGNSGEDASYENKIGAPACLSNVVSVGATDKNDDFAAYTNAAPILDLLAPAGSNSVTAGTCGLDYTYPDATWSAFPFAGCSYARVPGTSVAAPHVSGGAAVLRSAYADATPTALRDLLILSGSGISFTQGSGGGAVNYTKPRIDIAAALTPPSAPGTPSSLNVDTENCYGFYMLNWSTPSGTLTEYQVEASPNSSFSPSERVYFGPDAIVWANVGSTTYYRVRACNTVSCSGWRNGGSAAVPLGYCL